MIDQVSGHSAHSFAKSHKARRLGSLRFNQASHAKSPFLDGPDTRSRAPTSHHFLSLSPITISCPPSGRGTTSPSQPTHQTADYSRSAQFCWRCLAYIHARRSSKDTELTHLSPRSNTPTKPSKQPGQSSPLPHLSFYPSSYSFSLLSPNIP